MAEGKTSYVEGERPTVSEQANKVDVNNYDDDEPTFSELFFGNKEDAEEYEREKEEKKKIDEFFESLNDTGRCEDSEERELMRNQRVASSDLNFAEIQSYKRYAEDSFVDKFIKDYADKLYRYLRQEYVDMTDMRIYLITSSSYYTANNSMDEEFGKYQLKAKCPVVKWTPSRIEKLIQTIVNLDKTISDVVKFSWGCTENKREISNAKIFYRFVPAYDAEHPTDDIEYARFNKFTNRVHFLDVISKHKSTYMNSIFDSTISIAADTTNSQPATVVTATTHPSKDLVDVLHSIYNGILAIDIPDCSVKLSGIEQSIDYLNDTIREELVPTLREELVPTLRSIKTVTKRKSVKKHPFVQYTDFLKQQKRMRTFK